MTGGAMEAMARLEAAGLTHEVVEGDMGMHAMELALAGLEVFPLNGKAPAIPNPHPKGTVERAECHGECGQDGHGLWNASTDPSTVVAWWTARPKANIGVRVPVGVVVVDVDPRHGGDATLSALVAEFGPLPDTLMASTGGGGLHLWFAHVGPAKPKRLNEWARDHGVGCAGEGGKWLSGIDLKTRSGYVVAPPSIHPDPPHRAYRWHDVAAPVAALPAWFAALVNTAPAQPAASSAGLDRLLRPAFPEGDGPADRFCAAHRWADVLKGWTVASGNGEDDGSAWAHPSASGPVSATIRHGLLFVYSTSTPFEETTPDDPHGYTKFRAWATLEHHGDLSAAARAWQDVERGSR